MKKSFCVFWIIFLFVFIFYTPTALADAFIAPGSTDGQVATWSTTTDRWIAETLTEAGIQPALPASSAAGTFLVGDGAGDWEDSESIHLGSDGMLYLDAAESIGILPDDGLMTFFISGEQFSLSSSFFRALTPDSAQIRTGSISDALVSYGYYLDQDTGWRGDGANKQVAVVGESRILVLDGSGTYPVTTITSGAASGSVADALTIENIATGADGGGVGITLAGKDALDADVTFGTIEGSWLDESAGTKRLSLDGADSYTLGTMLDLTGDNVAIGTSAGNGQTRTTAVGGLALQSNTGAYSNGFGFRALENNTGAYSNGFGFRALQSNTGAYSNGFGFRALQNNTGAYSNGVGSFALENNTGANSNGVGYSALYNNTGANSNGFGYVALYNNTGDNGTGLGNYNLRYNQGDNNTAIGYNAWADFLEDTANNATFDNTDVDAGTDRITLTGHGFGDNDTYINVKYTEGTSAVTGLTDGEFYQVKIIDANTIGFYEADGPGGANRGTDITDAGSGTGHTITPQFTYSDSIVIGNSINATASNQTRIGGIFSEVVDSRTITDSGDGNAATLTLTPTTSYVELTCSDTDGCDITMGETGMSQGMKLEIINVSVNACNFSDTSGVLETSGAIALGQYDVVGFRYISDRWVQTGPVGNN